MQEQDIDLRECIKIVIKRRRLALSVFLILVITTAVIGFLTPKIYEVSMMVEFKRAGKLDKIAKSRLMENLQAKIEKGFFDNRIKQELKLNPQTTFTFQTFYPRNSELMKIKMTEERGKIETALQILNQLFIELSKAEDEIIELKMQELNYQYATVSNDVETKNGVLVLLQEKLRILEARKDELNNEIKDIKGGIEGSGDTRGQSDPSKSPLSAEIIQLHMNYSNQLSSQLHDIHTKILDVMVQINEVCNEIKDLGIQKEELGRLKERYEGISMVHEPSASSVPIKPKIRQNIAIAGLAGVIFGIFLAIFVEYWQKPK